MSNLGFNNTLIVATHGNVESADYGLSLRGVQETGFLIKQVSKFLPTDTDVMIATGSHGTHAYEAAIYFANAYNANISSLLNLDEDREYSEALELAIIGEFIAHKSNEFSGLIVVTTSVLSSWLSGTLHARGQSHLNLADSCAYVTKPDGTVYIASKAGYRKL